MPGKDDICQNSVCHPVSHNLSPLTLLAVRAVLMKSEHTSSRHHGNYMGGGGGGGGGGGLMATANDFSLPIISDVGGDASVVYK